MAQNVKTLAGVAIASSKTVAGVAIASVKTIVGVDNTGSSGPPATDLVLDLDASILAGGNALITNWAATTGPNASNGGGSARPTSVTSGQNGLNILRFDGVDNTIATSAFGAALNQTYVVLYAAKFNTIAVIQRFLSGIAENAGARFIFRVATAPQYEVYAGSAFGSDGTLVPDTNWHIGALVVAGASTTIRVDNSANEGVSPNPGTATLDGIRVSGDYDGTISPTSADVGQILVYSSTTSLAAAISFLQSKWGL